MTCNYVMLENFKESHLGILSSCQNAVLTKLEKRQVAR
jgi:hypothetical protein